MVDEGQQIASVWLASRRASFPAIPAPVHADDDVRRWMCDEVLPTQEVWVAEVDGRIAGMLVLPVGGRWVDQLYVDPEHQRRGVGRALLDRAKSQSPDGLDLWTFETNAGARRFYERHGFVLVESSDGRSNEERVPDCRYRWPTEDVDPDRRR
jgi:ribosomal protein S18 acetylase RimI-like enzyme